MTSATVLEVSLHSMVRVIASKLGEDAVQICELGALGVLPNAVVQRNLNRPMRFHVAGTMLV